MPWSVPYLQRRRFRGIEELLIISPVEAIFVDADGINFPSARTVRSRRAAAKEPSYVEKLIGPGSNLFTSPLALPQ